MNSISKQVLTEMLVLQSQRGDEAAFRDLHGLWREDLRRWARLRVEHAHAADEVVTDAWLAMARGLPRLGDPACFPRWAFRMVERRSADWIRRRSLDRRRESSAVSASDLLAPASLPAVAEEAAEDVLALRASLAALPAGQRELLHLYYETGCTTAEIAEILAIPAGTVKSRLFSIRETLRQQLTRIKS